MLWGRHILTAKSAREMNEVLQDFNKVTIKVWMANVAQSAGCSKANLQVEGVEARDCTWKAAASWYKICSTLSVLKAPNQKDRACLFNTAALKTLNELSSLKNIISGIVVAEEYY